MRLIKSSRAIHCHCSFSCVCSTHAMNIHVMDRPLQNVRCVLSLPPLLYTYTYFVAHVFITQRFSLRQGSKIVFIVRGSRVSLKKGLFTAKIDCRNRNMRSNRGCSPKEVLQYLFYTVNELICTDLSRKSKARETKKQLFYIDHSTVKNSSMTSF